MSTPLTRAPDLRLKVMRALRDHAPAGSAVEPHLEAAIEQSVASPGKLVRGCLALQTVVAHGGDETLGLKAAAAVEYFHLASLLLDDLPCMDDAFLRRGRVCVHRVHGEATAILAALALINRAYALWGDAPLGRSSAIRRRIHAGLDRQLGVAGLLGGQARDLRFHEQVATARAVRWTALRKTGSLLALALLIPAELARPNRRERHALHALIVYWSLAFQAADDLQDRLASEQETGKTTGRDAALGRPNLVQLTGLAETRRSMRRWLELAAQAVRDLAAERPEWAYLQAWQHYFQGLAPVPARSLGIVAA